MKQTYFVSEFHMSWLKDYIEKINKRAVKLKQKEITYSILNEKFTTVKVKVEQGRELIEKDVVTKVYTVEIEAEPIKAGEYRFVASIEHTYENGNIVHSVDDIEIPTHYHTVDGICEHCNTNRRRKITVVLQNEEGGFIQIGRSCLKDYIGWDIEAQLKYMDLINELIREMSEPRDGYIGSGYIRYINLAKYLTFVEKEISEHGWVSKSSVEDYQRSTSYQAELRMNDWEQKHSDEEIELSEYVQNAIKWIRTTQDTDREYMMNLQIMCKNDFIRVRDMGYVASLLNAYKNHLDYIRKQELKAKVNGTSQHVGVIGKREVFTLTLERYTTYSTEYGTMWIYIFRDSNGNCFKWKSSKCIDTKEGEAVKLKGTVKEHSEFNGEKQTVITRCAIA